MTVKNKKKLIEMLYLVIGTGVLFVVTAIVSANFFNDSSLFGRECVKNVEAKDRTNPESCKNEKSDDEYRTIKYEGIKTDTKLATKTEKKPSISSVDTDTISNKKISVEVVNYTGIKTLAGSLKNLFESKGFQVSAGNSTSSRKVVTTIIDRSNRKVAEEVRKILKAGKIESRIELSPRFDVTVIIGDDYNP